MPGSRTTLPHTYLTLLLTLPLSCHPDDQPGQVSDPHGCRTIILPNDPTTTSSSSATTDISTSTATDPTEASTTQTSSSTTGPMPFCGDGNIDDGEECDDGPDNRPEGPCTDQCTLHPCGNGTVEPPEECDDANRLPGDGCDSTCTLERYTVFVTSTAFTGALPPLDGRSLTGLDLADAHCQAAADSADRPGTYRAWLSLGDDGPLSRFAFPAGFPGHFVRVDGATIAEGWDDLLDSQLALPIAIDETGATRDTAFVWTNTDWDGSPILPLPCVGWESESNMASAPRGRSGYATSSWTSGFDSNCSTAAHFYCFEVPPP